MPAVPDNNRQGQFLCVSSPGVLEVRQRNLPALAAGEIRVRARYSLISAGTETLYFQGLVPRHMIAQDSFEGRETPRDYPLYPGYAVVGLVEESLAPQLAPGTLVFCFHAHADHFTCASHLALPLPQSINLLDAVFLATMETALTFVLDVSPRVGERIKVFGLGTLGLLSALILQEFPLDTLVVQDVNPFRCQRAADFGLQNMGGDGYDALLEVSGQPAALNQALEEAAFSARIVLGSWYGLRPEGISLGGSFHRKRLRIVGSQVSSVAPELSGLWDKRRIRRLAVQWLARLQPARLITAEYQLHTAGSAYAAAAKADSGALVFSYPPA